MSQPEDEAALNAAWMVLRQHNIPDGLLGVFYLESRQTHVLLYEEEGCGYQEWVPIELLSLSNLPVSLLEAAALRLVKRMAITRRRFLDPRKHLIA